MNDWDNYKAESEADSNRVVSGQWGPPMGPDLHKTLQAWAPCLASEFREFLAAVEDGESENVEMEFGDAFNVLMHTAFLAGIDPLKCGQKSLEKLRNRKLYVEECKKDMHPKVKNPRQVLWERCKLREKGITDPLHRTPKQINASGIGSHSLQKALDNEGFELSRRMVGWSLCDLIHGEEYRLGHSSYGSLRVLGIGEWAEVKSIEINPNSDLYNRVDRLAKTLRPAIQPTELITRTGGKSPQK